jgi:hypothetical protein
MFEAAARAGEILADGDPAGGDVIIPVGQVPELRKPHGR